jgi:hypothetical protein
MFSTPRTARVVAVIVIVVFLLGFCLSIASGAPRTLPAVALSSPLLFHVERAVVGAALVGAVLIVLLNLLRGELPSKLSTTGLEWPAAGPEREVLAQLLQVSREQRDAIQQLSTLASRDLSPEDALRVEEVGQNVKRMDRSLREAERQEAIADAIGDLPVGEKLVIGLIIYDNLSVSEVAKILGVGHAEVDALLTRAVKTLRKRLADENWPD